eukprot:PhF_6_TR26292/c0_g1_i2/m.37688/K18995/DHX29; ATP-dependent RNA helicase DHX29
MHSVIPLEEQREALQPCPPTACKVLLSTNIAETSITIPDVTYVIDLGLTRRLGYNEAKKVRSLHCTWASKSGTKQRAGRCGRVMDGIVYRLYTRELFESMSDFDPSECMPLEHSALKLRVMLSQYGTVDQLMSELVEPPPTHLVEDALDNLTEWNALGPGPEYKVTKLGEIAVGLPLEVHLTRAVLAACGFGCASEMIAFVCALSQSNFPYLTTLRVFHKTQEAFVSAFRENISDILTYDRN